MLVVDDEQEKGIIYLGISSVFIDVRGLVSLNLLYVYLVFWQRGRPSVSGSSNFVHDDGDLLFSLWWPLLYGGKTWFRFLSWSRL